MLTAVAASLGAAVVGAAFSPINPFQVIIAQNLAQLPPVSGWAFRTVFLAIALAIWIAGTLRHARRHRVAPELLSAEASAASQSGRAGLVLLLVLVVFAVFGYGVVVLHWDFAQMSALFFGLGVGAGLLGGLGLTGTAEGFADHPLPALDPGSVQGDGDKPRGAEVLGIAPSLPAHVLRPAEAVDIFGQAVGFDRVGAVQALQAVDGDRPLPPPPKKCWKIGSSKIELRRRLSVREA